MINLTKENLLSVIAEFKSRMNIGSDGVVFFYNERPYGWRDSVRNPETELPGVIAVDEKGNQWRAEGGDDYHGAERWTKIHHGGES